jgi:hypothetical protein
MSTLVSRRARRLSSFGAAFALVISALAFASPAQAAVGVTLDVNDTTITQGESVTLSWTSTEAIDLVASGQWSGNKANPAGSEVVTPAAVGDFTYTLTATDENGREATESVTVTVAAAAPAGITPAPVTFPDPCTVVVPSTPNVTYFVDYGDDDIEEVDADTYDGGEFAGPDFPVKFFAQANDGFTLADGAVAEWEYTAPESCFGEEATLVKASATCGEVTFDNVSDGTVTVLYGDEGEEEADGEFNLGAGKSRSVKTNRDEILFVAFSADSTYQIDSLDVPQNCNDNDDADHPTVAPAAGVAR